MSPLVGGPFYGAKGAPENYTLKPKYTVVGDFETYVSGWETSNRPELEKLLARAERYIDLLGSGMPIQPCDAIQAVGMNYTTAPTGGTLKVRLAVKGIKYTSGTIPYNATYATVQSSIDAGKSVETGGLMPGPVQTFEGPLTPFVPSGPLPYIPVVVAFTGGAGGWNIPEGEIVENNLTGGANVEPYCEVICPGAPWGGRFNPSRLLEFGQLQSLKNAVCAQALYMFQMGPRFFQMGQYDSVAGPDFTTKGRLPKIAPEARKQMALSGLTASMARSRP